MILVAVLKKKYIFNKNIYICHAVSYVTTALYYGMGFTSVIFDEKKLRKISHSEQQVLSLAYIKILIMSLKWFLQGIKVSSVK